MSRHPFVAGISLAVFALALSSSALQACVGEDAVEGSRPEGQDASTTSADGSTFDGPTGIDAPSSVDAATDTGPGVDATPPDFCQSAAAAGAAFCVDFQTGANVADGWDSNTASGGATILRNDAFGFNSTRSATIKLGGTTNSAQGTLSKVVSAGALKSKVNIQYDAFFVFPAWPSMAFNGFVTGITRTAALGLSSQYYFDLERQPTDWKLTSGDGTPKVALATAITPNVWHHIDMTYDATVGAAVTLIVDSALVGSLSLSKGTPPSGAPATFDQVIVNAGAENLGVPATATELTIDNVIVRFP